MYLTRLQIQNCGPLRKLDISLPFDGPRPKPILLVGENGSGKTIAISNIVNSIVMAKDEIYKESSEVDSGMAFKIRSTSYISVGAEYSYARTDFDQGLFAWELVLKKPRSKYRQPPDGMNGSALEAWKSKSDSNSIDLNATNIGNSSHREIINELVSERCLLYFPSDRAEEPAWLNQTNLRAKPQYTYNPGFIDETRRKIIARSPLRDIIDWLYDVIYDRAAFGMQSRIVPMTISNSADATSVQNVEILLGHQGEAANLYNSVLNILQNIVPEMSSMTDLRIGVSNRHDRNISLRSNQGVLVPNLFQLSSGEMALAVFFLSILRDFDLRKSHHEPFTSTRDIKGLVVVDEVDMHLHAIHQYDVLPKLLHMFPQIQFVITTHSPLFVLGMERVFRNDGFEIYDLPSGSRTSPESFDEFWTAYRAFSSTIEFTNEIKAEVAKIAKPILYVEGQTDCDYLQRAAELLDKENILRMFKVIPAGNDAELKRIWKVLTSVPDVTAKTVVLLHDPETQVDHSDKGRIHRRKMPCFEEAHPIRKGIEHLFTQETIEKAVGQKAEFIDIVFSHTCLKRGERKVIPDSWSVNSDEKRNLCNWLCKQGTQEDFQHFEGVFSILEKIDTSLNSQQA